LGNGQSTLKKKEEKGKKDFTYLLSGEFGCEEVDLVIHPASLVSRLGKQRSAILLILLYLVLLP
jgi:hypothetical protein